MINIFKTNNKKIMRNESYVEKMAHFIVQRGRIIEKFFIAMNHSLQPSVTRLWASTMI